MKTFNKYPIFLWLLPLFFFLLGYTNHGNFLHLYQLGFPYILIYLGLLAGYLLLNFVSKHRAKNALLLFYLAGLYLFFGNIKSRFDYLSLPYSYTFFFLFLIAFPVLLYFVFKKYPKTEAQVFSYCNVLIVVLCLTQCVLILQKNTKPNKFLLQKIGWKSVTPIAKPSIHLILWDGYPGFHSLKQYFNFSNEDLKSFLQAHNFLVLDSIQSNYFQTYISVNSLLNMQYISYLHQVRLNEYNTVLHELKGINESAVPQFLKALGYHIENNSIFELDGQEVHHQNPKFKSSEQIHFNEVLHHRIMKDFLWRFTKGANPWKYAYDKIVLHQYYQNNSTIDNLLQYKASPPHFTYSHIIMPHEPYYTDSVGKLLDRTLAAKENNELLFINYLKYTNLKIKEIVSHLQATEPNSIVILMSDHGYREYVKSKELPLKFDNLMAIHLPDSNYGIIKNLKTNVNLFRVLLNQYFNQNLPLLRDSCITIDEEKNYIRSTPL